MSREGGKRKERTEEYLKWEERKGKREGTNRKMGEKSVNRAEVKEDEEREDSKNRVKGNRRK